jgi:hypothetical protein
MDDFITDAKKLIKMEYITTQHPLSKASRRPRRKET